MILASYVIVINFEFDVLHLNVGKMNERVSYFLFAYFY